MYYHFSTISSFPLGKGMIISRSVIIGLESSSEEIELELQRFYHIDKFREVPFYAKYSLDKELCETLAENVGIVNHTAFILVDDLEFFLKLLNDSKSQNPQEDFEGSFCILDNMSIHWILDKNNVILAAIHKMNE